MAYFQLGHDFADRRSPITVSRISNFIVTLPFVVAAISSSFSTSRA